MNDGAGSETDVRVCAHTCWSRGKDGTYKAVQQSVGSDWLPVVLIAVDKKKKDVRGLSMETQDPLLQGPGDSFAAHKCYTLKNNRYNDYEYLSSIFSTPWN